MAYPIKICAICSEEFELKPGKPGFANHCPNCSSEDGKESAKEQMDADDRRSQSEMNAERRRAMRNLLYRKDS